MASDQASITTGPVENATHWANDVSLATTKDASGSRTVASVAVHPQKDKHFWLKEATQVVAGQWFLLSLGILIAIASQVQVPSQQQELKRTVTSYLCISIIFFVCVLQLYRYWLLLTIV